MAHDMRQICAQEMAHAHCQAAGPVHAPVPLLVGPIQGLACHTYLHVVPVSLNTIMAGWALSGVESAAVAVCG